MIINHVALLLDRSGSMQSVAKGVIDQFNLQATLLSQKAAELGQKTLLSLYTFSDIADMPMLVEVPLDLVSLNPIAEKQYHPDGQTAMLDSIGLAIDQLSQFERGADDSFLIICITDGEENHSQKYVTDLTGLRHSFSNSRSTPARWSTASIAKAVSNGWSRMSDLIKSKTATDKWTFVFLTPVGKKSALVERLNLYDGNVQEWEQTAQGIKDYGAMVQAGVNQFYAARAMGTRSTKGFFTDLSSVSTTQVAHTLADVTGTYRKATVMHQDCNTVDQYKNRCVVIKDFCVKYFNDFHKGMPYYSLTKKEEIQQQKDIVIEDRQTGKLYSGDTRQMLGLPKFGTIKVAPGDHGKFCIYVQSTSDNRKLVEGQTVLYYYRGAWATV